MKKEASYNFIAKPSQTAAIMKKYGLKMKKSLGQNFLIEPQILNKMVDLADIDKNCTVIEIGPGIGALTQFLAMRAKRVIAFEIDQRFVEILSETLVDFDNVTVIAEDILKVDFSKEAYKGLLEEPLMVVANLPYYITTPIIMHLLQSELPFQSLVMLMQKEVAQRMTASVGTKAYNSLSVAIQMQMASQYAFVVPRTVFVPQPKVDSAVLKLTRLPQKRVVVADDRLFERFVQQCFKQRRKTLWNNLKSGLSQVVGLDGADSLEQAFKTTGIDPQRRAETLTVEEFAALFRAIPLGWLETLEV